MEYALGTNLSPAFTGLFASVLLICLSSALFFRFIPVQFERLQRIITYYFMVFFLGIIISYLFLGFQKVFEPGLVTAISNLLYIVGFHAMRHGLKIRQTEKISHLHTNKWFWLHVVVFSIVQCGVLVFYINDGFYRILFVTLNLILITFSSLAYIRKDKNHSTKGENVARVAIWVIALLLCMTVVVLLRSDNMQEYLIFAIPIQVLNVHIAVLSLCTLLLSESIDTHYSNSITDSLTGLYNRRFFMKRTKNILADHTNNDKPCVLIACDIDHFKCINDEHGHDMGDKAITAFADLITQHIPSHAVAARIGGEEFAIFLPNTVTEEAEKLANKLRKKTQQITIKNDTDNALTFTASFGVAVFTQEADIQKFLLAADEAMYFAKSVGRDRVVFYDDLIKS